MKPVKIAIILIFLSNIASCKKTAIETDPNYEGLWLESDYCKHELTIEKNGCAGYGNRRQETDCDREGASGKAKIKKHKLLIGRRDFFIDLPPTIIDTIDIPRNFYYRDPPVVPEKTIMKMILNGETFYKVLE